MRPKKLTEADIQKNTRMYDLYHNEYLMEDGWLPGNKEANFQAMLKLPVLAGVSLKGTSCIDVGCGSGDLSVVLRRKGVHEYFGIDIYKPSIQKAKEKYPNQTFLFADFLSLTFHQIFDYAFCSGALTVRLNTIDNYSYLAFVISKMWNVTRVGLVFNVLTDDEKDKDPGLFFYAKEKVVQVCTALIPSASIFSEPSPNVSQIHVYLWR